GRKRSGAAERDRRPVSPRLLARGQMSKPVRRIVTGHRPDGRSTIVVDAPAPNVKQRNAGNASTLLWVTEASPANLSGNGDRDVAVPPPWRGSIFRIAEL